MKDNTLVLGMYAFVCVGLLVNAYLYITLPETLNCTLKTGDGLRVSGNCSYIVDLRNEIDNLKTGGGLIEADGRFRVGDRCPRLYELYLLETK